MLTCGTIFRNMEKTIISGIEGSADFIPLKKFAIRSIWIGIILSLASGSINSVVGTLIVLAGVFLLKTKNWARILYITVASLIVVSGVQTLLSFNALSEQISKIASETGWNATFLLVAVLLARSLIGIYFIYSIHFLLRPNIKNLFLTQQK